MTIQGGGRRIDLALLANVPILELTPVLAAVCQVGAAPDGERNGHGRGNPPAWSLTRADGQPLELTATLAEAGVRDGEVLYLVDVASWRSPRVSELAGAVSDVLERDALRWPGQAGRWLLAGLCTASLLAAGGMAVTAAGGGAGWAGLGTAAAGAMVAMVVTWRAIPAIAPGGVLVSGVLALAAAGLAEGAPLPAVAGVVAVAGVLALRVWARVVDRALVALVAPVTPAAAEQAARRSRQLLASLSAGTVALVLGAVLALLAGGGGFAVGLAVVSVLALALQAQTYRFVPEALPPALAAGAGLLAVEVIAGWRFLAPQGRPVLAVALLASTGLALAGLMLLPQRPPKSGLGMRLAWLAVDLAIGPLALGTLGVVDLMGSLAHHLWH